MQSHRFTTGKTLYTALCALMAVLLIFLPLHLSAAPHAAPTQGPVLPQIGPDGRLLIPVPHFFPRLPTDSETYFQNHKAYEYKAAVWLPGNRINAEQIKGYTLNRDDAVTRMDHLLGHSPTWPEWRKMIQENTTDYIEILGWLERIYPKSSQDYNAFIHLWPVNKNGSDQIKREAFEAISPSIRSYNRTADHIEKQLGNLLRSPARTTQQPEKNTPPSTPADQSADRRTADIAKGIARVRSFQDTYNTDRPYGFTGDELEAIGKGQYDAAALLASKGYDFSLTPDYWSRLYERNAPDSVKSIVDHETDNAKTTAEQIRREGGRLVKPFDPHKSAGANVADKFTSSANIINAGLDGLGNTTAGRAVGAVTDYVTPQWVDDLADDVSSYTHQKLTDWAGSDPDRQSYAAAAAATAGVVADNVGIGGKGHRGKNGGGHHTDGHGGHHSGGNRTAHSSHHSDSRSNTADGSLNHGGGHSYPYNVTGSSHTPHDTNRSGSRSNTAHHSTNHSGTTYGHGSPSNAGGNGTAHSGRLSGNNGGNTATESSAKDGGKIDTGISNVKIAPLSDIKGSSIDISSFRTKIAQWVISSNTKDISIAAARVTHEGKTEHFLSVSGRSWKGDAPDRVSINGTTYTVIRNDNGSLGTAVNGIKETENFNHAEMKLVSHINTAYRDSDATVDIAVQNTSSRVIGICQYCSGEKGNTPVSNLGKNNPNMNITVYHGTTGVNP